MDPEKNTQIESAEELEAEKQHLGEVKEDEVRDSVIKEFGFDPEADKERIDKLVAREMDHKKTVSTAIKQKIGYRTKFQESTKTPPAKPAQEERPDVGSQIEAALEKDRLDSMEYPDDIKAVIKNVAKVNGISVRKAVADPYVQSRIETWKKDSGADEAAVNRTNKGGKGGSAGDDEIPDFDLTTEQGRKDWDKWKEDQIAAGK